MGKRGPKPKPTEQKRKLGNPGKRSLPALDQVEPLPPAIPREPLRPLAAAGMEEWHRVWAAAQFWLAEPDVAAVQVYCEAMDDYVLWRNEMLGAMADDDVPTVAQWRLRKQVLDARVQVDRWSAILGVTPASRAELGVAEVRIAEGVANMMDRGDDLTPRTIDVD
jgi:phage terminase small subunit